MFPPGDNELVVRERVFLPGDDEFASRGRGGGFGDVGSTAARLRVERTTYIYIYTYIGVYVAIATPALQHRHTRAQFFS